MLFLLLPFKSQYYISYRTERWHINEILLIRASRGSLSLSLHWISLHQPRAKWVLIFNKSAAANSRERKQRKLFPFCFCICSFISCSCCSCPLMMWLNGINWTISLAKSHSAEWLMNGGAEDDAMCVFLFVRRKYSLSWAERGEHISRDWHVISDRIGSFIPSIGKSKHFDCLSVLFCSSAGWTTPKCNRICWSKFRGWRTSRCRRTTSTGSQGSWICRWTWTCLAAWASPDDVSGHLSSMSHTIY